MRQLVSEGLPLHKQGQISLGGAQLHDKRARLNLVSKARAFLTFVLLAPFLLVAIVAAPSANAAIPTAPASISYTASTVSSSNPVLQITFGAISNSPTTIWYSTDNGSNWKQRLKSSGSTSTSLTSPISIYYRSDTSGRLVAGTTYTVKIQGRNSSGTGTASSAVTAIAGLPQMPSNISYAVSSGTVTTTFSVSSGSPSSFQYSTDAGSTWATKSTTLSSSVYTMVITKLSSDGTTDLVNGTTYPIQLRGVNSYGNGFASSSSNQAPGAAPSAPTSLIVSPGNLQATVSWTAPTNVNGYAVSGYKTEYSTNNTSWTTASSNTASATTSYTFTGLSNGSSYYFRVSAINSKGTSSTLSSSSSQKIGVPSDPTITGITPGDNTLSVAFTAPTSTNGASITNYEYSTNNGSTWSTRSPTSTSSPLVISSGVSNGTTYTVAIRAVNSNGSGVTSNLVQAVPANSVVAPAAPTISSITAGNTQASVVFTPGSDGGASITNYKYSINGGSTWVTPSPAVTSSPLVITGLTNGTSYSISIKAVNSAGDGAAATAVSVVPATTPGAPTSVTLTAGDSAFDVSWIAPSSNGGNAVKSYKVEYLPVSGSWTTAISNTGSTNLTYTVTGLSAATSYSFRVSAINDMGTGSASTASSVTVAVTVPGAPTITSIVGTYQQLNINFTVPTSDGGSSIIDYEYSTDNGTNWDAIGSTANPIQTNTESDGVTTLSNKSYSVKIRAVNAVGHGAASSMVTGTPNSATKLGITTQPSTVANGATMSSVVVKVQDSGSSTVTSSAAQISVSIASGSGSFCDGVTTTVTASSGIATFSTLCVIGTIGSYTLNFTADGLTDTTSNSFTLSVGSATKVVVTRASAGTASGAAFTTQPQVTIQDSGGNTVTGSSAVVTATISAGGTLEGTKTATASSGIATFSDLGITGTAGTPYTITYTGAGGLTIATASVTVTVGSATKLAVTRASAGTASGATFTTQPQVTMQDSGGNTVTSSNAVVTATISAGGTLEGTKTATASSGIATFSDLGISGTAGTEYTITYGGALGITVATATVTVTAGSGSTLSITTSASGAAAHAAFTTQPVIQLKDSGGNNISTSGVTVTATLSSGTFSSGSSTATATSSSGVATFSGLQLNTVGSVTITYSVAGYSSSANQSLSVSTGTTTNSIALTGAATTAKYATAVTITATVGQAGAVNFKVGGSSISGCSAVSSSAGTATCSWTPAAVNASTALTAVLTPTDVTYALVTSATLTINVGKATPVITWTTPSPIRPSVTLSSTQLSATASVAGTFAFTPASGDSVTTGTVELSATFTPTDTTNYEAVITTRNLVVLGAISPGAPTSPVATTPGSGSGTLDLSWTAPTDDGGAVIDNYEYRIALYDESSLSWSDWTTAATASTSKSISGLGKHKYYVIQIRAHNSAGYSTASTTSTKSYSSGTEVTIFAAPTNVLAVFTASTGNTKVNFTPPVGATDSTNYQYSTDDGVSWKSVSVTSDGDTKKQFTLSGLTKGTTYKIKVRGLNEAGNGSENTAYTLTPVSAPNTPTIDSGTPSSGKITVVFSTSTDTGGQAVTYQYRTAEEGSWVNVPSNLSPFEITSISNDQSYPIQMRARNATGDSNPTSATVVNAIRAGSATIRTQPSDTSLTNGQTAGYSLTVSATASSDRDTLSYQWYKNSEAISGATAATYTVSGPITTSNAGTFYVIVTATANGTSLTTQSNNAVVTVNAAPSITSSALAGATKGSEYSATLAGTGGVPSYTFSVVSGSLPTGLTLSSGTISGTVSNTVTTGTKTIAVTITDSKGVSTTANVTIVVSASISITTSSLGSASKGSAYSVTLAASGGNETYTWSLGEDSELPSGLTLAGATGVISGTPTNAASSKTFTIRVTDGNRATTTSRFTINITSAVPNAPTSLTATSGDKSIVLAWTAPTAVTGVVITNYIINFIKPKGEHNDDGGDDDEEKGSVSISAPATSYTLTGLKNGLSYTVTVSAKSSGGTGTASNSATAVTAGKASAPTSVTAGVVKTGISVRWKKPEDNGGKNVTSWKAECLNTTTSVAITKTVSSPDRSDGDENQYRYTLLKAELTAGASYKCRVLGTTSNGDGSWSSYSSTIVFATVPSTPGTITTDTTTGGKVVVSWLASSDDGGSPITSYSAWIYKKKDGESEESDSKRTCTSTPAALTCTLVGVPTKGTFNVYVSAVNELGESETPAIKNVIITGKTQTISKPSISGKKVGDADFNFGVTNSSGLKLVYSVVSPYSSVCSISYKGVVHIKIAGTCRINYSQDGHRKKEDDSDDGDSEYEPITPDYVEFSIADRAPTVPTITSVTIGNTQLTLNWSAPSNSGGIQTGYEVQSATNASCATTCIWSSSLTPAADALSQVFGSLTNGIAYQLRILAKNAGGSSAWVVASSTYTPYTVPNKPVITNPITGVAATSTVTVAWSAVTSNGSSVTSYVISGTATGLPDKTCTVGGSTTSCAITGIQNDNTYSFTMVAKNAAGTSAVSDPQTIKLAAIAQSITVTSVPSIYGWTVGDPDLQINASANSGLPLQWSINDSSVCSVTSSGNVHFKIAGTCEVYIKQNGKDASGNATKYAAATDATPIQLVIEAATPSAPTITSVTNDPSGLVIVWSAPSRVGGGTIYYNLSGVNGGSTVTCVETASLGCTINSVTKGLSYAFTVTARNTAGTGSASNTVYGTWMTVPSVPIAGTATSIANASNGKSLDIFWKKSVNDNGSAISRYVVSASSAGYTTQTCSVNRDDSITTGDYSCTVQNLRAGVSYAVSVVAKNSVGDSSALSIGNIIPGLSQTVTVSTPISKFIGNSDFTLTATATSGGALTFATSDSTCTVVSGTGLVHIVSVGTCTVTATQAGATNSDDSMYKSASANSVITISAAAPGKATITKVVGGDTKLTITWTNPTFTGGATLTQEVTATASETATRTCTTSPSATTCEITGLTNTVTYTLVVKEINTAGNSLSDSAEGVPFLNSRAPMPITATGGIREVALTWVAPAEYEVGYSLHHYVIYKDNVVWLTTSDSSTVSATVSGLANFTTYSFKARAVVVKNADATVFLDGDFTSIATAKTLNVPSAPSSLGVTATSTTLAVSWNTPEADGGSSILSYVASATAASVTTSCPATAPARTCTITGLTLGTTYAISVTATNAVGTGSALTGSQATTAAPTAPELVSAVGTASNGTVLVSWNLVADPVGAPVTSYLVTAYTSSGGTAFKCSASATSTSCTVSGIAYKTDYTFKVVARNTAGSSPDSNTSSVVNLVIAQSITFDMAASAGFNVGSIVLTASASSGLAVTYTVSTASICSVSGSTLTFIAVGTCTVSASQNGADSNYSAATPVLDSIEVTAVTPPAIALSQVAPGASKLTATWSAATQFGGSTLSGYVLSWAQNADFSDENSATVSGTTSVINGLLAKTTYRVRIKVVTTAGTSSGWSNVLVGTTFGLPAAPTIGTPSFTTPGVVTVNWTNVPTADNGGTPVTGYTAEAYNNATSLTTGFTCSAASSTCDISGLNGALTYFFKVTATNAVGSATSAASDTKQPGTAQTITPGNMSVTHAYNPFLETSTTTSGLPLLFTKLADTPTSSYAQTGWGTGRTVCSVTSSGTVTVDLAGVCTITVSQDGTDSGSPTQYFAATSVVTTVTVAATAPSVVTGLTLTPDDGKVTATWLALTNDGGAPIISYLLNWYKSGTSRSDVSHGAATVTAPTLSYLVTGLTNGTTYTFEIQAVNKANLTGAIL